MILATIGMNDAPYGKMFQILEEYAKSTGEEVIMQTGNIEFESENCKTVKFLVDAEMQALFDKADLIVAHAGVGSILNGLKRNVPLVLVPRTVVLDCEHDQQDIVARKVAAMGRGVVVEDLAHLIEKINEARKLQFGPYVENTDLCDNLAIILDEIDRNIKKKRARRP